MSLVLAGPGSQPAVSNTPATAQAVKKLTWDNGIAAAGTVITLFEAVSDLVPVAGPLAMGLGVVKEIFAIVQQVKDNKQACEAFTTRVMQTLQEFAVAAKSAGRPILPGSSAAVLLEPFLMLLKRFHEDIQAYAGLPALIRTFKKDEIAAKLASHTDELKYEVMLLAAKGSIVQVIRSDFDLAQQTQHARPPKPQQPAGQLGPASSEDPLPIIEEPDEIPTSAATSNAALPFSIKDQVNSISTAVRTEIKRRNTLEQQQASADAGPDEQPVASTQQQHSGKPFTSEEMQQLRDLEDQMKRLFLRGEGEDLGGIFGEADASTVEGDQDGDDLAQSALHLLDGFNTDTDPSSETSSHTLRNLRILGRTLRQLGLLDESLVVLQLLTALCRRNVAQKGFAVDRANLSAALQSLCLALRLVGRYDEALACSEEAASTVKQMADRQPAKYRPALAGALITLAIDQADQGQHGVALSNGQESVDIYRSLYAARPAAFKADLARALNNYSVHLSSAGRHTDALEANEESVKMYRALYGANEESVKMYRALYGARPTAFEAALARALFNYSNRLSEAGRHKDALEAIEESVKMYRSLYRARPAAVAADLARALVNYSNWLSEAGRHKDALEAIEDSIKMYRSLYGARPAAFQADLAGALFNYSIDLSDAGRHEDALEAIEESVKLYRSLHAARPAAFEADLAASLNSYSLGLSEACRDHDAVTACREGVQLYRSAVSAQQQKDSAELAAALDSLSICLHRAANPDDAIKASEESIKILRPLFQERPEALRAVLAEHLVNYSLPLINTGRHKGALEAIEEGVALYQEHSKDRPDAEPKELARALGVKSICLGTTGHNVASSQLWNQALTLDSSLATTFDEYVRPLRRRKDGAASAYPSSRTSKFMAKLGFHTKK
ncbi:hypothetical protein OC844_002813 [Tilletia horrida]|nr:hypothetical protein OC844_002813 [Tilletia horrida]